MNKIVTSNRRRFGRIKWSNEVDYLSGQSVETLWLTRFIFLYFWLLIFDGSLRKWVLPGLAAPLLVIRDPVVVVIVFLGIRRRLLGQNPYVMVMAALAAAFCLLGLFQTVSGVKWTVVVYGLRTYFLHLPLIFVIGMGLPVDATRRLCRYICITAIAMTPLIVLQFFSPPGSLINIAIGGGEQIAAAGDKIRPAGTFSYILGVVYFYSCAFAIALAAELQKNLIKPWLARATLVACMLTVAISGSRTLVTSIGIVFVLFLASVIINRRFLGRSAFILTLMVVAIIGLFGLSVFREGISSLNTRFVDAGDTEGGSMGFLTRISTFVTEGFDAMKDCPLLGHGLGMGTNVGSQLITNGLDFLLAEGEWPRVVLEAGPAMGFIYLLYWGGLTGNYS